MKNRLPHNPKDMITPTAAGLNSASYTPATTTVENTYYYCVVTNTIPDNGDGGIKTATAASSIATILVNAKFWVAYNGNGGTSTVTDAGAYSSGDTVTVKFTPTPTWTGYTFAGWATSAGGAAVYTSAGTTSFVMGSENVTLYAKWTAASPTTPVGPTTYKLSYDGNGNTGGTVPAALTGNSSGALVTVSGNTGSLSKTGRTFSGWNTKADGTGAFYAPKSTFAMGSADVVLYAVWSTTISYENENWASNGQNGYIVAYEKATGRILPMSYYDEKTGYVLYNTKSRAEILAKYNFISFSDINEDFWASDYIWFLSSRNVINGMGDGTFQPESNVTRAQFVKIMALMVDGLDFNAYGSSGFNDVKSGQWYEKYINWAASCGIVEGYGNGLFGPNDEITREQMCCIIDRFCKYLNYSLKNDGNTTRFADENSISTWAKVAVNALQGSGLINGRPNNRFEPQGTTTRAEAATIACRLLRAMMSNMEVSGKIEWKS